MRKQRKFSKYKIQIRHTNGDKENINIKTADDGSYKSMLEVYKRIKRQYAEIECNIDFLGESDTGQVGIIFTKENKLNKPDFQIIAEKYANVTMLELLETLNTTLDLIDKRGKWLNDEIRVLNKMQDIELHKIESYSDILGEKEKVNVFNNIKSIRESRRILKEDELDYEEYVKLIKAIDRTKLRKIINIRKEKNNFNYKYLDDKFLRDNKIFTKVKYKNIDEKNSLIWRV